MLTEFDLTKLIIHQLKRVARKICTFGRDRNINSYLCGLAAWAWPHFVSEGRSTMATSFKDLEREFSNLLISDVNETGKELGRGSYGEVREAELLGAPCATKRVHPILLTQSGSIDTSKVAADFVRECRTWKNLRHPNIVQLFGVFFEQDSPLPVLVMERLSTSLRYYLKTHTKEVVPQERKATILRHVALGLAYLHKLKNVHRDLSPNNILLDTEGWRAKITDFGVSRAFVSEGGQMTGTSAPGTKLSVDTLLLM